MTTIDLTTGEVGSDLRFVWNGTGGLAPEGPHIYSKDGWYYLMIAEGGTGLTHMETIARSKTIDGPYTPNSANPILTNANTSQYFQTVGHADLFQDPAGNWWGVSLATRSGPNFTTYPMGRETVMFPVTWKTGDWPILQPVRGQMSGWQMPPPNISIAGEGYVMSRSVEAIVMILTVQTFHGYCRPPHLPSKVKLTNTPCPLANSYQ
jgi:beta-xylosidase